MERITTSGLDLAKNGFQVHGVDAAGKVLVRKQLRRAEVLRFFAALPPCLVGIEAYGTAHHWARELTQLGHTVRLMPPTYVKPYFPSIFRAAVCCVGSEPLKPTPKPPFN